MTNAYRLVNGAGDGLDGLVVDRYGEMLVVHVDRTVQLDSDGANALLEGLGRRGPVYVKRHASAPGRLLEEDRAMLAPDAPLVGEPAAEVVVLEHGARYGIRPAAGLSVGLFLDMREVRGWVREHAAGQQVLNLFAYTCSFGVAAMLGGAERVLNLDLARGYLAWGMDNYRLNGLEPVSTDFVYGDAFDWLKRFARRRERFDLVVLDPPSFSTSRSGAFSVERDYARLVGAAAPVLAAGGVLLAATNLAAMPSRVFEDIVTAGLRDEGRGRRVVHRWNEPALDFPVASGAYPYLKVRVLQLD